MCVCVSGRKHWCVHTNARTRTRTRRHRHRHRQTQTYTRSLPRSGYPHRQFESKNWPYEPRCCPGSLTLSMSPGPPSAQWSPCLGGGGEASASAATGLCLQPRGFVRILARIRAIAAGFADPEPGELYGFSSTLLPLSPPPCRVPVLAPSLLLLPVKADRGAGDAARQRPLQQS